MLAVGVGGGHLDVFFSPVISLFFLPEALPGGGGGGGGVSAPLLPENNTQLSPAPFKYFLVLPKIILLLLPKIPKVIPVSPQLPKGI